MAQTYYKYVGTDAIDADAWPDSGLTDADGNELYTFVGDEGDSTNGASADWVVSTPVTTPESDTTVTTPTPTDNDVVANSQPADAVAASGPTDGAVVPTTNTPTDPAAAASTEDDEEDASPIVAVSSDVVGGPAVIDAADADALPEPAVPFEGTSTLADRADNDADVEAVQKDNASDTAAVAAAQAKEDESFRLENPDSPVVRAANPNVGGERF